MAGEIRQRYSATGATLYAILIRASDGKVYNGTTFETPAAASWGNYDLALTEQSTTQLYYADMPAVSAGLYDALILLQAGGAPATTDTLLGVASIDWGGSSETTVTSRLASTAYTAPPTAADIRSAVGLAAANLDTQLGAIVGYIDTEVSAIYSRIGAPVGASLAADVAAIKSDTASILDDTGTSGVVVASLTANAITAAAIATDAGSEIADAVLSRSVASVEASAPEHSLCTLILGALESSVSSTTWTIKRTDGSTTHATKTVTTDDTAEPIVGVS